MKNLIILFISLFFTLPAMGQNGLIRGILYDSETGETIPYATVYLENDKNTGTSTDLDGAFELELQVGTYDVSFSYIGYATTTIKDIVVRENEIQVLKPKIQTSAQTLREVVIIASQLTNTESALMTIKRKSPNVIDGISRELFSKAGDGDAGSAIRRVTGVSIVDGKHVLVRGLGDRYSKTVLDGTDIPGLDPDRNSVQIDLFPTQLIENIMVSKTFLPNLPGDFSGGLVNIKTREFPEKPLWSFSLSVGYNPSMNLSDGFLSQKGSPTDFLGWDNGLRNNPLDKTVRIPDPVTNNPQLSTLTQQFNPQMNSSIVKSSLNQSYGLIYGNQWNLGKGKLGLIGTANYKKSFKNYDNLEFNTFLKYPDNDKTRLFSNRSIKGQRGDEEVLLNGMAGITYKLFVPGGKSQSDHHQRKS